MTRIGTAKVSDKVLYPELSYQLTGLLFSVHNSLGRYCREKQYADALDKLLTDSKIRFNRELALPIDGVDNKFTNKADFVIEESILIELKVKPIITKEDYSQVLRYLGAANLRLGVLVNFRNKYLKPIRIIR